MLNKIEKFLSEDEFKIYEGYSGRGMFGRTSKLAITTDYHPSTFEGKKLIKLGLKVDNMGMSFIYYLT